MSDAIAVVPQFDFSDVHFTRSASGHVHSAWWSYDWKKHNPNGPYLIGSHFHGLRERSLHAFADALGISANQVIVSVRENPADGQLEWRCGTVNPVHPPKPKRPQLTQAERMRKIESLVSEVERGEVIDI